MGLQIINLGVEPTGVGGDNYRQAHTKINANFVEISTLVNQLDIDRTTQFTTITNINTALATKAAISDVNAKNTLQDSAISANATSIVTINQKNTAQDTAITANNTTINTKVDNAVTALQAKDTSQDTAISLRALTTDVNAKNTTQDTAINTNTANIGTLTTTVGTHDTDIANLKITAGGETVLVPRTISITGDADWLVTYDGTSNVSAAMTIRAATTTVAGIVQLNSTTNSTSTTQAATASAVRTVSLVANAAIPSSLKGAANGVASLGADGKVPASQLSASGGLSTDATGNLAVSSIQAGVGAPKLKYFEVTGTTASVGNSVTVALPFTKDKIIALTGVVSGLYGLNPPNVHPSASSNNLWTLAILNDGRLWIATVNYDLSQFVANRPFRILITYAD